jgi:hypothetical protein
VTNLTSGGTIQQLIELLGAGVLPPFCNLLDAKDWNTVIVVLDGLTNMLHAAQKMGEMERIAIMIEEAGGLDKLEALQQHENEQIYQKSMAMIDTFFSTEVCIFIIYLKPYFYLVKFRFSVYDLYHKLNKNIHCQKNFSRLPMKDLLLKLRKMPTDKLNLM